MRGRWYAGKLMNSGVWLAFHWHTKPSDKSHGRVFRVVSGPFKTEKEAKEYALHPVRGL